MNKDLEVLLAMLRYRRPAYSATEQAFCRRFIEPIGAEQDSAGNWLLEIGDWPATLWSCHTDTIHHAEDFQSLRVVNNFVTLPIHGSKASNCLGADCTVGVWLMLELIKSKVPGLYVFHAAEEKGGVGSRHLAKSPEFFDGIKFAVAFDRRGCNSVITHQALGRCCSDRFAEDLSTMLDLNLRPDNTGVFTDTASYVHLVPECTNLSVGYYNEHSRREFLNFEFLFRLRDSLVTNFDETKLEAYRDPNEIEPIESDPFDWLKDYDWNFGSMYLNQDEREDEDAEAF